ncbi:trichohyalin-like [Ixodes scapularis]|uniref:trichohyalin-like n=1 Tax=Ixodes scapularis TaxID=6945 RepID=UPI001A9CDBD6|nr:trichohyalin-like [Ixodes scapularis]
MNAYHEKKSVKKKKNKKTKEYCSDNDEKKNHKDKENTDSEEEGIYLEREVREEIPETGEDDFPDERKTSRNAANKNKTKDTKKDRPQTQELSQASLEELLKTIAELTRTTIKVMDENAKIKAELSRINEQTELIIQENLHLRELDLLQNNARLNESEKARTKTYSQALGTQSDDNNETPKQDDNEQEKKYTLLVTTKGSQEKDDHIKVGNLLKKSIDPADVGLTDVRLKPIRGGLAITTNSKEAIDKLERKINETKDTREKLEYKKPRERNPQISITQVERELTEEEITKATNKQEKVTDRLDLLSRQREYICPKMPQLFIIRTHTKAMPKQSDVP